MIKNKKFLNVWFEGDRDKIQKYKDKVIRTLSTHFKKMMISRENCKVLFLCTIESKPPADFKGLVIPFGTKIDNDIINQINKILFAPPKLQKIDNYSVEYTAPDNKVDINRPEIITPNDYFDEIYIVNLLRNNERWMKVKEKLIRENIFVTRWEGKDKQSKEIEIKTKEVLSKFVKDEYYDQSYSAGTCAIFQTYIELFDHIKQTKDRRVLLLQDDILFHKDFKTLFDKHIRLIPQDWQIWYPALNQFTQYWEKCKFNDTKEYFIPYENWGLFGVAINTEIIDDIIERFKARVYNKFSSDAVFVKDLQLSGKYKIYASYPALIGHAYGRSERCGRVYTEDIAKKYIQSIYYDTKIYR